MSGQDLSNNTLLMVIIAILLPPLAVGLKKGAGGALVLGIILWLLFYVPGLIYALYVVLKG
ncbi:MAG: YqaE/Pmp3 family membrane protein [Phycisphaerales bacterium JB040]